MFLYSLGWQTQNCQRIMRYLSICEIKRKSLIISNEGELWLKRNSILLILIVIWESKGFFHRRLWLWHKQTKNRPGIKAAIFGQQLCACKYCLGLPNQAEARKEPNDGQPDGERLDCSLNKEKLFHKMTKQEGFSWKMYRTPRAKSDN